MKKLKKTNRFLLLLIGIFLITFIAHRGLLIIDARTIERQGTPVEIDGKQLNIYTQGEGETTLLFLSTYGVSAPYYEFYPVFDRLKDDYRIVIVERFGQGFSSDKAGRKDLSSLLEDTLFALDALEIEGPFTLVAHGLAFFEALYWLEMHPDMVQAVMALDPAMPELYAPFQPNPLTFYLQKTAEFMGMVRLLPILNQHPILTHEDLSSQQKKEVKKLMHLNVSSRGMFSELNAIASNAKAVLAFESAKVPVFIFSSNGLHTGFDENDWVNAQIDYAVSLLQGAIYHIDAPHFIHLYEAELVARLIKESLESIN